MFKISPMRYKKSPFFNIISLTLSLLLLWQNIIYAYPAPRDLLRVPVGEKKTYKRMSEKAKTMRPEEVVSDVDEIFAGLKRSVSHYFNNRLQAIYSSFELIREGISTQKYLDRIEEDSNFFIEKIKMILKSDAYLFLNKTEGSKYFYLATGEYKQDYPKTKIDPIVWKRMKQGLLLEEKLSDIEKEAQQIKEFVLILRKLEDREIRLNKAFAKLKNSAVKIKEIVEEIQKAKPAIVSGADAVQKAKGVLQVQHYRALSEEQKKILLDSFFASLGEKAEGYILIHQDQLEDLLQGALFTRFSISSENSQDTIVALGQSPAWIVKTMQAIDERPERFVYVAFSGGWYEKINNGYFGTVFKEKSNGPISEQKASYKQYLTSLKLDPTSIAKRFEENASRTIFVEYTVTGVSLKSFLSFLIDWAQEQGVSLDDKIEVRILVEEDFKDDYSAFGLDYGFTVKYVPVAEKLIAELTTSDRYEDRLVPRYPCEEWNKDNPLEPLEYSISNNARLVHFRILDFLAGLDMLNNDELILPDSQFLVGTKQAELEANIGTKVIDEIIGEKLRSCKNSRTSL